MEQGEGVLGRVELVDFVSCVIASLIVKCYCVKYIMLVKYQTVFLDRLQWINAPHLSLPSGFKNSCLLEISVHSKQLNFSEHSSVYWELLLLPSPPSAYQPDLTLHIYSLCESVKNSLMH